MISQALSYIGIERGDDGVVHGELDAVEGGDLGQEGDKTILIHLHRVRVQSYNPIIASVDGLLLTNNERYSLWKYFSGTDS